MISCKYSKRSTLKSSSCFVCLKQSLVVLRNDQDWFYVCESHLKDLKFCKVFDGGNSMNDAAATTAAKDTTTAVKDTTTAAKDTTTAAKDTTTAVKDTTTAVKDTKKDPATSTDATTTKDTTTTTQMPTEFILDSTFLQMRQALKKPKVPPKQIKFPEIPKSKFI
jgi:AAA-ATPase Vps4-associated protein 1